MDFSLNEEQAALRELARQIFRDGASHERSRELAAAGEWFDAALWSKLAAANLTALALPEEVGGSGCGIFEVCLVVEEMGRALAPVPLLPTVVLGGLPIARFGSDAQRDRWLRPVAEAEGVLSAALYEVGGADPAQPRTRARRDGDGWRLDGEKICVPAAELAQVLLVPARSEQGVGVFLLEPGAEGMKLESQLATHAEPQSRLLLDGARVGPDGSLGEPGAGGDVVGWIVERANLAQCAALLGVAEQALRNTAEYTSQRRQFGRPVGSFQAAQLRAADAWIDLEAMRATLTRAAWRLAEGREAALDVAAAKWWACRGGQRVVHTAQHLHGGIGADVAYPIHRHLLWSKQLELALGGANQQLAKLGALLARGAGEAA